MPKTIQIPVDDELYAAIVQKARDGRLNVAAYCRYELAKAVIGIPPKPVEEPKPHGRPPAEKPELLAPARTPFTQQPPIAAQPERIRIQPASQSEEDIAIAKMLEDL